MALSAHYRRRRSIDPLVALVWLALIPLAVVIGWYGLYRLLAWLL